MTIDPWRLQRWGRALRVGDSTRKLILQLLCEAADYNTGVCEPRQATIAEWAEVAERTVRRHLAVLEETGIIARRRRFRSDGTRRSDAILILAPGITGWPEEPEKPTGQSDHRSPVTTGHAWSEPPDTHGLQDGSQPATDDRDNRPPMAAQEQPVGLKEKTASSPEDVDLVFAEWVNATGRDPARTKLTPDRRRRIQKALDSHGEEMCLAAVRNIGADEWASGHNDRGRPFNDIQHALGNAERIERWATGPSRPNVTGRRGQPMAASVTRGAEVLRRAMEGGPR